MALQIRGFTTVVKSYLQERKQYTISKQYRY